MRLCVCFWCIWCDSSLLQDFLLGVKMSVINIYTANYWVYTFHSSISHNTNPLLSTALCQEASFSPWTATYHVTTMGTFFFFFFLNARQTIVSSSKLSHQNTHMDESVQTYNKYIDRRQFWQYRNCFSCLLTCQVSTVVSALWYAGVGVGGTFPLFQNCIHLTAFRSILRTLVMGAFPWFTYASSHPHSSPNCEPDNKFALNQNLFSD